MGVFFASGRGHCQSRVKEPTNEPSPVLSSDSDDNADTPGSPMPSIDVFHDALGTPYSGPEPAMSPVDRWLESSDADAPIIGVGEAKMHQGGVIKLEKMYEDKGVIVVKYLSKKESETDGWKATAEQKEQ
ncbi:hypothetical protein FMUND_7598 [Fusarium mundagurra]|uniref:Uncharacterized protein n=1 Tax=Fusarium mundagurra TaxID=1567541 RepID=A0A8H5YMQ5_9HYPO|nr:hypothetical protein FMUND_7598 [Fusarium mundagurra]